MFGAHGEVSSGCVTTPAKTSVRTREAEAKRLSMLRSRSIFPRNVANSITNCNGGHRLQDSTEDIRAMAFLTQVGPVR
jgi:hypothetical protein